MQCMHIRWSAAAALAAALAGCGDSGSDTVTVDNGPERVPASATVSASAYTAYVAGLPAADQREPVVVDGVTPPTSETAEPVAVAR